MLVHLRSGPPPSPDGQRYNLLASGSTAEDAAAVERASAEVRPPVPGKLARDVATAAIDSTDPGQERPPEQMN